MQTAAKDVILEKHKPTLQTKRPLMPIEEYAAREGVSRQIIEECGQLGIAQIRKHRGKTYVVDVPISPYPNTFEETGEPVQIIPESEDKKSISWPIITAGLFVLLILSVFANFWFLTNQQIAAFDSANALSVPMEFPANPAQISGAFELQNTLDLSREQGWLYRSRDELYKIKLEVLSRQLDRTAKDLEALRHRNAETLKQIEKQLGSSGF